MDLTKDLISKFFTYVRTWDVTEECPEGSMDEYEFRCMNFICRLMYHKEWEWEKPHWELEASTLKYPRRKLKVDWLNGLEDLMVCTCLFINADPDVGGLHERMMTEVFTAYSTE